MSRVQVLVAAMHQKDHQLLEKMNIQSDVIVGNQCDYNSIEEFNYRNCKAVYLNFNERGVGLNRNNALMRAVNEICILADDDLVYVENYPQIIETAYDSIPDADVIVFNLIETTPIRYIIPKKKRIRWHNFMRYGAARISFKLDPIKYHGISFNLCFGGGTEHNAGEDNLFLASCLKSGLKIYALPIYLAKLETTRDSTWFKGYDQKYIKDQGYLYKTMSKKFWFLLCLQDALRKQKTYNMRWTKSLKLMIDG